MAIQIHQVLFDGRAPAVNRRCLSSWLQLQPRFEIQTWGNEQIRRFVDKADPLVRELLTRARNFGEASDILRIAIVHEFGGLYTDWDIYLLDPQQFAETFDACAEGGVLFLKDSRTSDRDFSAIVTHSFFYAAAGTPSLHAFLQRIRDNYRKQPALITIHVTGPHAFTRFLLDGGWNLDDRQFVEQDRFFRHGFHIAAQHNDKARFLEDVIKTDGTAPLVNLWTSCWIDPPVTQLLKRLPMPRRWFPDPFRASMNYILSE